MALPKNFIELSISLIKLKQFPIAIQVSGDYMLIYRQECAKYVNSDCFFKCHKQEE